MGECVSWHATEATGPRAELSRRPNSTSGPKIEYNQDGSGALKKGKEEEDAYVAQHTNLEGKSNRIWE